MRGMMRRATTDELYRLMEITLESDPITNDQADLLYDIIDELTERGEIQKPSKEEVQASYRRLKDKIFKLTKKIIDESEDPHKIIRSLMDNAADDELNDLAKSLPAHDRLTEQEEIILCDVVRELSDRNVPILSTAKNDSPRKVRAHRKILRKCIRPALVAVSVILALFLTNAATLATGFDFFGSVARWSKDAVYFVFGNPTEDNKPQTMDPAYTRLKATLEILGINVHLPYFLPYGFEFDAIEPDKPNEFSPIIAWFARGSDEFSIGIRPMDTTSSFSEVNDEAQSEIYKGHYLITFNVNRTKALWYYGIYELQIQGNLTYEELTQMLDSILKE
jgi:hypothetical protein